jgi:hypothetical protein
MFGGMYNGIKHVFVKMNVVCTNYVPKMNKESTRISLGLNILPWAMDMVSLKKLVFNELYN